MNFSELFSFRYASCSECCDLRVSCLFCVQYSIFQFSVVSFDSHVSWLFQCSFVFSALFQCFLSLGAVFSASFSDETL